MSTTARLALLAAAAVVLVAAFVLLRPSGDDDAGPGAAAGTTAPAATQAPAATTPEQTTPAEPAEPPEPELPTVRVRGGEVVGGVQELEFRSGDEVAFRVRSDVADEIHVHGYDVTAELRPGRTTTVRFDAELEGVFDVELHGTHAPIAELRVSPS